MQENREGKNEGNLGRKQDSVVDPWGGGDGPGADVIICPLQGQLSSVKSYTSSDTSERMTGPKWTPCVRRGKLFLELFLIH